jgi:hypothetical protein
MRFTIPEDNTMTTIPGNTGTPPNVSKGPSTVRPPNTVGNMRASSGSKGSGGGMSGAGPNGTTKGPGGTHIKGFMGSPPATSASNADKSPRNMSNPNKVSSSPVMPGCSKTSYSK